MEAMSQVTFNEGTADEVTFEIVDREARKILTSVKEGKVDGAFVENGYLYLTSNDEVVAGPLGPFSGTGGGSGGGGESNEAVITLTNASGWLTKTISYEASCPVTFTWSSLENELETGSGVLKITVNGTVKSTSNINQGTITIDIGKYLALGSNTVKINVSDVYGNSRTINYTITTASFSLASSFDASVAYDGAIEFTYTPTGSATKTMHFVLDGTEIGTEEVVTSGRQKTYTIPAQSHGVHTLRVYFEAELEGETIPSNELYFELICIVSGNSKPIIASSFNKTEAVQYESLTIPYTVYDPDSLTTAIELKVDGETVSPLTVDRTTQEWTYRPTETGSITLQIVAGETTKTFTLTVAESDVVAEAETENLALYLSSYGRSNNEEEPASWVYNDISAEFSNFNFTSDGWQTDEDGITVLRVAGDARLTIPYQMFAKDFRTSGKTIEIEFTTRNVMNYDSIILSCFTENRGIQITPQKVVLKSQQSEMSRQYKEDEHVRISFVVEKRSEVPLIFLYIDGICSGVVKYPDDDDFSQASPVGITIGSNDCTMDLYNIRVYDNNLNRYQILDNWIADTQSIDAMLDRFERNSIYDEYGQVVIANLPKDLPYLVLEAKELPQSKGDKKTVSGYYIDPLNDKKSFTFEGASCDVQGTSSQYYKRKNYKIKFSNGFTINGTNQATYQMRDDSIGVDTFTFKADVASSEGANNVELVRLYNDICPYKTPPQEENGNVRQGIDGFPIVVFWNNGNETVFLGKYNFNNDKATEEVFGFESGDESWEIKNNTSDRSMFKSADFSGTAWLEDFEGRYPDGNKNPANLKSLATWLVSTDQSQATNATLGSSVTYDGVTYTTDSAEYRLAKFKAEAENWLEIDSIVFSYIFTELFLMVDSRAKNNFPTKYVDGKWCVLPYDMDTAIGINNEGLLVFDYNLEDTDTVNGANVYNGQNSVLYINTRDAFGDRIETMYKELRADRLLTYDDTEQRFENHQALWSEAIFNEDAYFKYIQPLIEDGEATYLSMCQGSKESQRKWWLFNRFRYIDSKYTTGDALSQTITLRCYQKSAFAIVPYADIYACVAFDSTRVKERATRSEECPIISPEAWNPNGSDAVVTIYSADQLKDLGDLSAFKVGYADFSKGIKLQSIKVGDASSLYSNENMTELYVGNNTLLKTVDVRNCPNLATSIDLSGCTNIEEAYFDGTAITGVSLPNGGILKTLHLPATITALTLRNQKMITDFVLPSYANITTLRLENVSDAVDSLAILNAVPASSRVRLIGFDWEFDSASDILALYDKLDTMRGLDENHNNVDKAQMMGTVRVENLTGAELAEMQSRYPNITVAYENITSYLYYYNYDGSVLLHTEAVVGGGNGTYTGTPTRTSTAQYTYTFAGWSLIANGSANADALKNITGDRIVYAAYTATLRTYTVYFYNYDNTLLYTATNVPYGGSASFVGDLPTNNSTGNTADFTFRGWNPQPTNITGDTKCYAQFNDLREITDSWATIASNVANGTATSKYGIGAFKTLDIGEKTLPYDFYQGSAVVYNGEIHIMGSEKYKKYHYKWDGSEWASVSTLPYELYRGSVVVYNDEIHILGGNSGTTNHYKWNGTEWESVSTLPYSFYQGSAVVYNGEIHIMGSTSGEYTAHYKWDGADWLEVSTLPYDFHQGSAVVLNGEIHILGSNASSYQKAHYKWDGTTWVSVSTLPYNSYYSSAVVYNDEIHILGCYNSQTSHRKWNGSAWESVSTLPYNFYRGSAVVYNDEVYIMGSNATGAYKNIYSYSTETATWSKIGITESIPMQLVAHNHDSLPEGVGKWESLGTLPYSFYTSQSVILNGEIHIIGSNYYGEKKKHYKWNGSAWESVSTLPYEFYQGSAVVYNGEIHILGGNGGNTNHYKWNGSAWESVSTLPYSFYDGSAVVYNNEIHIFGSYTSANRQYHYKWAGTEWVSVGTLPITFYQGSAVVYNDEIHLLSSVHYKYNGSEWVSLGNSPYSYKQGSAVVMSDGIHLLGGASNNTKHYVWNGTEWTAGTTIGFNFYNGNAVNYNDSIVLLGSQSSAKAFYALNTTNPTATLTFIAKNLLSEARVMNSVANNTGGWSVMPLRTYLNGDFLATLPSELQSALTEVAKLSDGGYNSTELVASNDKVWIPSISEVGVTSSYTLDGQGESYSTLTESRVRSTSDGVARMWWLRSCPTGANWRDYSQAISTTGGSTMNSSTIQTKENYLLIGFCI